MDPESSTSLLELLGLLNQSQAQGPSQSLGLGPKAHQASCPQGRSAVMGSPAPITNPGVGGKSGNTIPLWGLPRGFLTTLLPRAHRLKSG